jgi:hypothetical protein
MMSIIVSFVKLTIICMIGVTIIQIHSINQINEINKEEQCKNSDFVDVLYIVINVLLLLLMRMFYGVFAHSHNEIDWEDDLFEFVHGSHDNNNSKKYNIMRTFYIIQIVLGYIGILSVISIWNYFMYPQSICRLFYEFVAFGFFPYILISLKTYYKLCFGFMLAVATIISPKKMFIYFDELLENRCNKYRKNIKIFTGNAPECCVCYEEKCWIIKCGHLVCKNCVSQFKKLECPLCKSSICFIQSYENYKKLNNL